MNAILFFCVFRNYALLVCHSICIHTKICLFLAYIVTKYCTPWANTWIGLIVEQKSHHHSLYAIFSFENWTGIAYIRVCPLLKREYLCNSSLKWPHWIVGVNAWTLYIWVIHHVQCIIMSLKISIERSLGLFGNHHIVWFFRWMYVSGS